MRRSGISDLPLHGGRVPAWLYSRMEKLSKAIIQVMVMEYGRGEVLRRISDPFWFQSLGAVLGMDWHSSGITTSVMGALKRAINAMSEELGIYVCGGRGKHSRKTPLELQRVAEMTGLPGSELIRNSKLTAKIDNTAIQDGFQLYLHSFLVTKDKEWAVVQQGMNTENGMARRYHWLSHNLSSFLNDPHASIYGKSTGQIINLVDTQASDARRDILSMSDHDPEIFMKELRFLKMPSHHDVQVKDVNLKRLGAMLYAMHETRPEGFESLLLKKGLGPRTLQSLALVSEVIHGTPVRFQDPARFSFAHGGKDGHPFPVPLKVYNETIDYMDALVREAKIESSEKKVSLEKLHKLSKRKESGFIPDPSRYDQHIKREHAWAKKFDGKTVFEASKINKIKSKTKEASKGGEQLRLF